MKDRRIKTKFEAVRIEVEETRPEPISTRGPISLVGSR